MSRQSNKKNSNSELEFSLKKYFAGKIPNYLNIANKVSAYEKKLIYIGEYMLKYEQ